MNKSQKEAEEQVVINTKLITQNEELKKEKDENTVHIQALNAMVTGLEQEVKHKQEIAEQLKTEIVSLKQELDKAHESFKKGLEDLKAANAE